MCSEYCPALIIANFARDERPPSFKITLAYSESFGPSFLQIVHVLAVGIDRAAICIVQSNRGGPSAYPTDVPENKARRQ